MRWLCIIGSVLSLWADPLGSGVWESVDYGLIFEITRDKARQFDVTPGVCVLHAEVPVAQVPYQEWERRGEGWAMGSLVVKPLARVPAHCTGKRDKDPQRNLEILATTFQRHYAFFDRRGAAWQAGRKQVQAALGSDWFPAACQWLESLGDAHVTLSDGKRECGKGRDPKLDRRARALAMRDYLLRPDTVLSGPAKPYGRRRIWVGRLRADSRIGYVNLFTMGGFAEGQDDSVPATEHLKTFAGLLDEILSDELRGVEALVIDLRFNAGGFDQIGLEIASRLTGEAKLAYTKRAFFDGKLTEPVGVWIRPSERAKFRGAVAVLIGPATVSAGETAAIALRALPQVRLMGLASEGALSDRLDRKLPNGWEFSLSNEIYTSADGQVFEGTGVPPQERVENEEFGAAIEAARRWLEAGLKR